jgi:hypothetical protein
LSLILNVPILYKIRTLFFQKVNQKAAKFEKKRVAKKIHFDNQYFNSDLANIRQFLND